jgi:hypothetical protein
MPTWGKVLLITGALVMLLLFAAGIIIPKLLQAGFAHVEETMEKAQGEGEKMGAEATLEDCAREAAKRSTSCTGMKMVTCFPEVSQFLWACLEAAPYEDEFCAPVPDANNEPAIRSWAQHTCRQYGIPSGEECPFILTIVPAFCSAEQG